MNDSEPLAEYTVRDFSAVEAQIQQIADREKIVTQKLKIANYKQIGLLAAGALVALGMFLVLAGIAYRIAFPPEKKEIIETTKIVEKIVQPPETNIVIQTPPGTVVNPNQTSSRNLNEQIPPSLSGGSSSSPNATELSGEQATEAIQTINQRLQNEGVATSASGVQASLSWNNFNDLDLMVREPNGNLVWFKKKKAPSGGILDIDANARPYQRTNSPVENITWQRGTASPGEYELIVMFFARDSRLPETGHTDFTVKLKTDEGVRVFTDRFNNSPNEQKRLIQRFTINPDS